LPTVRSDGRRVWRGAATGDWSRRAGCPTGRRSRRIGRTLMGGGVFESTVGGNPIDLSIGELGYGPPPEADQAAVRAAASGATRYSPIGGEPALRAALASKLEQRNGIPSDSGDVLVTSGASA